MTDIKVTVQTADQTRKAEITVEEGTSASEVLEAAINNWSLPRETEYSIANVSSGQSLVPAETLQQNIVKPGDVLEIQPVLVAGACPWHMRRPVMRTV